MTEPQLTQMIGLLFFASGAGILLSRAQAKALLEDFADHPAHVFVLSIGTVVAGFLVVTFYSNWNGNWPSVLLTVLGWIMLIKGLVSLVAAPLIIGIFNWIGRHGWLMTVSALLVAAVGGLMIATGFGWI